MSSQLIGESRIFADNYQFYVRDRKIDFFEAVEDDFPIIGAESDDELPPKTNFLMVETISDINDHWLKIFVSTESPENSKYELFKSIEFESTSKTIVIDTMSDEEIISVNLPSNNCKLFVCGKNIGIDPNEDSLELEDEQFKEVICESYDLYFVVNE